METSVNEQTGKVASRQSEIANPRSGPPQPAPLLGEIPNLVSRREFLVSGTMVAGLVASAGVAASFGWKFVYPTSAQVRTTQLQATYLSRVPPGSRVTRKLAGVEVILVNQDGRVRAFSTICPHLGCRVTWQESQQRFYCPCHAGIFDADGKVVSGPPPRPLDEFPVEIKGDKVYVTVPATEEGG